jgi:hypothetical protein
MPHKMLKHTNSVKHSLYRETASFSAGKSFPVFYETRRFIAMSNAVHIFSRMNAVHASFPISLRSTCNSILPSTPVSSKRALSLGVPYQISVCISLIKYHSACSAGDGRVLITVPQSFNSRS